ncbi:Uma2 family endonuclease [Thiococcus pfennigii]|uniref:Uma2 family endonuclease n=1 Tax=Thiococcus pfennigii TaxID=1057 RepID=UPI0030B880D1
MAVAAKTENAYILRIYFLQHWRDYVRLPPLLEFSEMQWSDVINDPSLRDLPYKIELDAQGRIVTSPASNRHGAQQARLVRLLARLLSDGEIATECSIGTHAGVKVADVVWMSPEFQRQHGDTTPYPQAPELCIEILSPSNAPAEIEDKVRLYLGYGAR